MSVVKDVDKPEIDGPTTLTYDITVTNDGNVTMYPSMSDILNASGVDSSVDLGDPVESVNTDGDLDVGETWTFQFTYDVTQDDIDDGTAILNTVCISDTPDADDCDDATTTIVQTPAMSVVKDVDKPEIDGPTTLTYDITVTNDGNVTMYPSMSDILNASGVDSSVDLGDPVESVNTDGDLDVGETWTFQFTYDVTQDDIDDGTAILNTVCISDTPDADDCDDATTTIVQTPAMSVVKDVDKPEIDGPTTLTYDITVTNDGNVTMYPSMSDILNASGVDSSVDLGDPVESVNTDGDLDVGETWTFQFTYDVTQDDIDDGTAILNTVCISDTPDADDCDDATTTIVQTPAMSVVKDVDKPEIDGPTTLTYDITVTNDGNVTMYPSMSDILNASGVDSSVDLGDPVESVNTDGDLDVGETWTFQFTYDVTQDDIDDGTAILNTVCISDTPDADDCDDATTTIVQTPAMSVVKDVDKPEIDGPTTLTYDITVTNDGNVTMYPSMSDILNASGVDSSVDLGDPVESVNTDGDLDVGETWTFQFTYDVTQDDIDDGTAILNTVCISDTPDADDCDDATTTIVQTPAMSVVKDVDKPEIDGPTTLTYDITVTNDGNVTMYPSMSDILNASGVDSSVDLGDPVESVNTDGDLDVGETWTFQFTYDVTQDDIDDGTAILNTVCISDTPDADDCDDATTTIIQSPAHTLVKAFVPDEVGDGEVGTFELLYTNTGNVTLDDIVITDEVDQRLLVDEASLPAGCSMTDLTLTCNAGPLAPDASVTFVVTFTALGENLVPDFGVDGNGDPNQTSGSSYVFYFENGYILYGSTFDGSATLVDPDGNLVDEADWDVTGVNQDIFFTVPTVEGGAGDDGGFNLHLSCSEAFIDGWGATGPDAEDDPDWRVVAYTVERYNSQGYLKDCTQTFPFEVPNMASATATPAGGTLTPNPVWSDEVFLSVVNIAPIEVTRDRYRRGAVEIQYFNTSYEALEISIINVGWPDTDIKLVSASYQDGEPLFTDLDCPIVDGACLVTDDELTTTLDARSKDWLKLEFEKDGSSIEPENVTVTIVTSDGATFSYVYNPVP